MRNNRKPKPHTFLLGFVFCVLLAAPGAGFGQAQGDRVPADGWMRFTDVEDAGFDPAKLEAARATWEGIPSSAFLVIADGAVVAAWGDVERRFMCHYHKGLIILSAQAPDKIAEILASQRI